MNILVVEDDLGNRTLYSAALKGAGHSVTLATDGAEGWTKVQDEKFDLVVTDYELPELTGWELGAKMRAADIDTPIILISGFISELPEDLGNFDVILSKPIDAESFLEVVEHISD